SKREFPRLTLTSGLASLSCTTELDPDLGAKVSFVYYPGGKSGFKGERSSMITARFYDDAGIQVGETIETMSSFKETEDGKSLLADTYMTISESDYNRIKSWKFEVLW